MFHPFGICVIVPWSDYILENTENIELSKMILPSPRNKSKEKPVAKKVGGRPREWGRLWEIIKEEDAKSPRVPDKRIASIYNQRYGSNLEAKATRKIVADIRYRYSKREK